MSNLKMSDSSMNSIYARIQNLRHTLHIVSHQHPQSQENTSLINIPNQSYSPMRVKGNTSTKSRSHSRSPQALYQP